MEKRSLGIILSVLGVVGLIVAAVNFINGGNGAHHIREILAYGILGVSVLYRGRESHSNYKGPAFLV